MTTSPAPQGKPSIPRSLLHPASNKAAAMSPAGDWLSYSAVPVQGESGWEKQGETICFRIAPDKAPAWTGNWKDSLIVFED